MDFFFNLGDLISTSGIYHQQSVIADQQIPTEIIQKIREQDTKTLAAIYKEIYPMVAKYVLDNNGSSDDAKDVFQDAMFLLIKKVQNTDFELTSKLSTFLYGVGKNLWLKKLTKTKIDLKDYQNELKSSEEIDLEEEDLGQLERTRQMKECIDKLGEPCKTIIVDFYFLKKTMMEIAEKMNYTNANNAKNQKYKCFLRLQKLMSKG